MLVREGATSDLALRLRGPDGAPLGEVFSYLSGLYFRGKLEYARRFGGAPRGFPGVLVITAGSGLLPTDTPIGRGDLERFASIPIDLADPRYTEPLARDVERLAHLLAPGERIALLGSVATRKYVDLLVAILGERLCFPEPFIGTGDMARGAMLLRAAAAGVELPYVGAAGAVRSLARPRSGRGG
jgi:hypothetical protein